MKVAMTHPVTTFHVDHVVGFGVFVVSQVSSLGQYVVDLLLVTFWRYEGRLFLMCFFLYNVLGAVYFCNISKCFIQSPLLLPSLSVSANTYAFGSVTPVLH